MTHHTWRDLTRRVPELVDLEIACESIPPSVRTDDLWVGIKRSLERLVGHYRTTEPSDDDRDLYRSTAYDTAHRHLRSVWDRGLIEETDAA